MDEEAKKVNALNEAYNNSQAQTTEGFNGIAKYRNPYPSADSYAGGSPNFDESTGHAIGAHMSPEGHGVTATTPIAGSGTGSVVSDPAPTTTTTTTTTPTVTTTPATTPTAPTTEAVNQAAVDELAQQAAQHTVNNPLTSQVNAINDMYEAQRRAQLAQLEGAYAINKSNAEAERAKIGQTYQQQANDLAAQYERNKRNFNLQAVINGINTGTASQAELANNAMYLRNYGNLRNNEAQADIEAGRLMMNLEAQYQASIAEAIAKNDYSKAAALLDEYNNQYTRDLDKAKILAEYGEFDGYESLYGKDAADGMKYLWIIQNRDLAYQRNLITKDQYNNLKNNKPMNEGLDANGIKVKSSGGGSGTSNYEYGDWSAYTGNSGGGGGNGGGGGIGYLDALDYTTSTYGGANGR